MTPADSILSTPVQYLKGVGPRRAEAFATVGIQTVADLLDYTPRAYIERSAHRSLRGILQRLVHPDMFSSGQALERESVSVLRSEVSILVTVERVHEKQLRNNRVLLEATIADAEGMRGALLFWNGHQYYRRVLVEGKQFVVTGVPELDRYNRVQFTHPQLEPVDDEDRTLLASGILPLYRLTETMRTRGITAGLIRELVRFALRQCKDIVPDPLPPALRERYGFPPKGQALEYLHFPPSSELLERARERMKFEEIFLFELLLALQRHGRSYGAAPHIPPHSRLWEQLRQQLPFALTGAQERVIEEIYHDLARGKPMNRLLHGDVGAGKTIVALAAMLAAVDAGYQALIAAPTEVLAEQHYRTIRRLTAPLGVQVVKRVGSQTSAQREAIAASIAQGDAHIIVGTHALFAESAAGAPMYNRVGLIIIDEQHRFGVEQRAALRNRAMESHPDRRVPHVLVMSATPIPRTLTMTLYGDLDVSLLDEMPPGRQPVTTRIVGYDQLAAAYDLVRAQIRAGHQAFIVYPLVDESEHMQLKAATTEFEQLASQHFPDSRLALIHGQMSWSSKEETMLQFARGDFDILVATTVVEVGIDVPNATVIVIHHAERFGLAQLHQLRGRVGRGTAPAYCVLLAEPYIAHLANHSQQDGEPPAATRLRTMAETTNGFVIAEVDLQLRGPGDMLGTRQAGMPEFRYVDLARDAALVAAARDEAFALVERDPHIRATELAELRRYVLGRVQSFPHIAIA
jgi:ATP-dependent DNA helicase RecG